jgi:MFS family permease
MGRTSRPAARSCVILLSLRCSGSAASIERRVSPVITRRADLTRVKRGLCENAGAHESRRLNRAAIAVLALAGLDFGLEQFMVVPLLPAVQRLEGTSLPTATWLLSGFLLAAVATAPVLGRLGDMYGKRRLLLGALAAFAIGSLVCALAGSIEVLIAGRAIQGVGAASGPLAIGLVRDHVPRERAPVSIGLLVAAAGVGAALGLVLTGVLVDHVSVSAVFWVLFGLAAALVVAVRLTVPETAVRDRVRPDWLGGLLLSAGMLAALLAISKGNDWGWDSARVIGLLAGAAGLLVLFAVVERGSSAPLLDLPQMARRPVWSANVAAFAVGFALFIAGVIVPQIATLPEATGYGLGLTITEAGLLLLPSAAMIVVGGWLSGRAAGRLGARVLVGAGATCATVAYLVLAAVHDSAPVIAAANALLGLGLGLSLAAIANLVVRSVGERRTSVSVAANAVVRTTGAALGAQVAAAVVIGAGVALSGLPAERGFTSAFVLGAIASVVALAGATLIPGRASDPLTTAPPCEGSTDVASGPLLGTRR